jgi:glucosamine--fructose-6-phosphate aminotransferase (isomerizing)
MCGIVGYIGSREATPILLSALHRLEYRGYDSAGLTVQNAHGLVTRKLAGRVAELGQYLADLPVHGTEGIAHTRWATHGRPTPDNAHPHTDCAGRIALVHNGIIENAEMLRARLEQAGHRCASDTDTEVLAHLIEEADGPLEQRVRAALAQVVGTYGLAVVCADDPGKIVVARQGSPVLLGIGAGEYFVASDAAAVIEHTRSVVYLDDGDIAVLTRDGHEIDDRGASHPGRSVVDLDWDPEAVSLGSYPHFMLKEICEQPRTIGETLRGRVLLAEGDARLNGLNLEAVDCERLQRIVILGCGTSWHAALVGRHILEELTGLPVDVEFASEFRHRPRVQLGDALTIVLSQSGETADTLEALRAARAAGSRTVGLVNVVGSSIAREADGGVYLHAGPEIGVASTKAFTSQITALLLVGVYLGRRRGLPSVTACKLLRQLLRVSEHVQRVLALEPQIEEIAERYAGASSALYLGRGINFPVALEGALKLKEISYIHAEGYPAAEMKHGPIALVDETLPVVFVAPTDAAYPKVVANMQEVKARSGQIIAVTTEGNAELGRLADHVLHVPAVPPLLSPVVTTIPLQLLAYYIAVRRGCDVDRPRNLAKSVTVE